MKKTFLILSIIVVIIVVGSVSFLLQQKNRINSVVKNQQGIEISSPGKNEVISSPLKIMGQVNGDGWNGLEGQVGTVKLFDSSNKELALGILTATEDWMKVLVNFETTLWFDYPGDGIGKLVFYNENPSGEADKDKTFTLPVTLSKSSSEKMEVKVYFNQSGLDSVDCSVVGFVIREIPKTTAPARAALEELLKGPTAQEKNALWGTAINEGVKVKSLTIENGLAMVDFSKELNTGVAGSCRVMAILSQITETLKQFPTVKEVTISIDGGAGKLQP